jgi:D-serine dehydratase
VLLELGERGGRTGARDEAAEEAVLAAIAQWKGSIALAGVGAYEGVLPDEAAIRAYLRRAVAAVGRIAAAGHFAGRDRVILTGAGSAWFDVVAEEFAKLEAEGAGSGVAVDVVLRPGCYLTHDVGAYREAQQRMLAGNEVVQRLGDGLRPAMHIWAYVQSRPEPQLAIIALGKRDAAFDAGLPTPALQFRPGSGASAPEATPAGWTLTKIMDQHAYMQVPADADVRIGDMIAFDISHPCLTWDKWRQVLVVDRDYRVVDLLQTYF